MRDGRRRLAGIALGAAALGAVLALAAGVTSGRHTAPVAQAMALPHHDGDQLGAPTAAPSPAPTATAAATGAPAALTPEASPGSPSPGLPSPCTAAELLATTTTDQPSYAGGRTVYILATVENVSHRSCLGPATCNGIRITVTGPDGREWTGSSGVAGCLVPLGWHPPVLAPGDRMYEGAPWDQSVDVPPCPDRCRVIYVPSGTYTAHADWFSDIAGSSQPFTITVPACTSSDVALSLLADRQQYTAGQPVQLTSTVSMHTPGATCSMSPTATFTASNGTVQVWSGCGGPCPSASAVVLGIEAPVVATATWDQSACTGAGCPRAPAGSYMVSADWGSLGRISRTVTLQ